METRGDVLIWILWEIQTDAIIEVRFGDADADTYKYEPMYKLLACWGIKIRISTLNTATSNGFFPAFFFSVDGILGKEALVILTTFSQLMEEKLEEPI